MTREMKQKKVYISGPITGVSDARELFEKAAYKLKWRGYDVVNPYDNGLTEEDTWEAHMRADLRMMLDCDAIALLPGWRDSRGACLEKRVAKELGMSIMYL